LLRPKFACCGGQEATRDEVAAAGKPASPDDREKEPEAKDEPAQPEPEPEL